MDSLWPSLAAELKKELPAQQFDTWIKPLKAERNGDQLVLLAPNHHVLRWVRSNLLARIESRAERVASIWCWRNGPPKWKSCCRKSCRSRYRSVETVKSIA